MKRLIPYILISLFALDGLAVTHNGNGGNDIIGQSPKAQPNWDIQVYPNPNNGVFNLMINGNSGALDVMVFNIIGEKVFALQVLGDHGAKIDLSGLEKGLYVVQVIDKTRNEVITRRMQIE